MNCGICNLIIEDIQPKTTLMCGHTFHTRCFIIIIMTNDIERIKCTHCDDKVVTQDIYQEVYPIRENVCTVLEESSEEFRNIVTTTIHKYKECLKSEKKYRIKINPVFTEYKKNVKPQLEILKNYIKAKKKEIKSLEEYKDLLKKRREFVTSINKIINTYNVSLIDFKDFIREYKKIIFSRKIIRNIYCSLPYTLDRKFSIRIS